MLWKDYQESYGYDEAGGIRLKTSHIASNQRWNRTNEMMPDSRSV
jgi:hypothetical protein